MAQRQGKVCACVCVCAMANTRLPRGRVPARRDEIKERPGGEVKDNLVVRGGGLRGTLQNTQLLPGPGKPKEREGWPGRLQAGTSL